ncbi:uncharacterized protein LOC120671221 [Panicum virgatum]|uniref:uncharacterized protein LOC120671221 n=1 Tax=Panicum virgatum TaxID=38727 RepID=UPI0019D6A32E|nr:uncharacterized protein LOC120671221 [Panicum virgatum]
MIGASHHCGQPGMMALVPPSGRGSLDHGPHASPAVPYAPELATPGTGTRPRRRPPTRRPGARIRLVASYLARLIYIVATTPGGRAGTASTCRGRTRRGGARTAWPPIAASGCGCFSPAGEVGGESRRRTRQDVQAGSSRSPCLVPRFCLIGGRLRFPVLLARLFGKFIRLRGPLPPVGPTCHEQGLGDLELTLLSHTHALMLMQVITKSRTDTQAASESESPRHMACPSTPWRGKKKRGNNQHEGYRSPPTFLRELLLLHSVVFWFEHLPTDCTRRMVPFRASSVLCREKSCRSVSIILAPVTPSTHFFSSVV